MDKVFVVKRVAEKLWSTEDAIDAAIASSVDQSFSATRLTTNTLSIFCTLHHPRFTRDG